jgi:CubicO group peptidase (beta-lactamase class C family)
MPHSTVVTAALGFLLLASACGRPAPRLPAPDPAMASPAPDTSALAAQLPALLETSGVPGLSIAVVRDGRVAWTGAFGTMNDSARTPLDRRTIFEAASLSKPVFAYLVLRLVDRGLFDLDQPLHEILDYPRLSHDERYKRITARIVLSHGTGLPNWGGPRLSLRFDPGTDYGYSGEGFVFLQKALERLTGHTLDQLARREVFEPLGMTRSSYVWQPRFEGEAAYALNWLWRVAPANRYTEGNAAASLLTTAPDYARFVAAVLTGRGLSPAIWREYLTPVREASAGLFVGLGIRVEDGPAGRIFYHSGNNGRRFTCYMTGDLERGTGLVYFTNAYNGTTLVEVIGSTVLGREHPPLHWAGYDRYDDPRRLAYQSVQRAAVERGADAARERLREIRADSATRPSYDEMLELGAFFSGRGMDEFSIEILTGVLAASPDSTGAHLALGSALEAAGDLGAAMESYQRAMALGQEPDEARGRLAWVQERLAARSQAVVVPEPRLATYAGAYQERSVTLRGGRLFYKGGPYPESPLEPMAEDLFEVEADPTLRVRFMGDGVAPAPRLIEISRDGSVEEAPRSP